jgi:hypothetical protein
VDGLGAEAVCVHGGGGGVVGGGLDEELERLVVVEDLVGPTLLRQRREELDAARRA